jgi:hypothetical protein
VSLAALLLASTLLSNEVVNVAGSLPANMQRVQVQIAVLAEGDKVFCDPRT